MNVLKNAAMLLLSSSYKLSSGRYNDEERHRYIAEAAYFKAEKRGFAPGHEEQDWREAESEFDAAHE